MKVTLESTTKIVELEIHGRAVPARVWQGSTENGVPVHAFITLIVPEVRLDHPDFDRLTEQFERDLERQAAPRATVDAIPLRFIIWAPP
jgi:hypothetical protein